MMSGENKLYWEKEKKRGEKEGKKREKRKRIKEERRKKENKKRKKRKKMGKRVGEAIRNKKKKHGGVSSDSIYFKSLEFPWNLSV